MPRELGTYARICLTALLLAGVALVGAVRPSSADDFKWPDYFNVITPNVGTANHSLAVAWTPEFTADTGVRVRVLPTPNGYARTEWLNTGQGKLSLLQPSDFFDQMDGVEGYASRTAGPSDNRVMYINLVTGWGYMVRGDSDIKSIHDVKKGTKVVWYSGSTFIENGIRALLAYNGLTTDDVELVEVGSYPANTKVVTEGRAEITFTSPISGTSYEAEAAPNGIRWIGIPEPSEDMAAYKRYRAIQAGYILEPAVSGVKSAIGVNMDHAFQTNHVLESEDPEFVYRLVKWLDQNLDKFKDKFTHAKMMNIDNLVLYLDKGALEPLHEGTIRYLTEKGLWKPAYQERQDKLVALVKNRVKVFHEALDAAADEGINTVPSDKKWVAFWADFKKSHGVTHTFGEEVQALDEGS